MQLHELAQRLNDLMEADESLATAEVIFAHQPHYPLQCGVGGPKVICTEDAEIEEIEHGLRVGHLTEPEDIAAAQYHIQELREKRRPLVYLCEISLPWNDKMRELSPYAPREAWGD